MNSALALAARYIPVLYLAAAASPAASLYVFLKNS
jgi:hypothetical protein